MYTCDNMNNMTHVATNTKIWQPFHVIAGSIDDSGHTIKATQRAFGNVSGFKASSDTGIVLSIQPNTQHPYHAVAGSINELQSGNRGCCLTYIYIYMITPATIARID